MSFSFIFSKEFKGLLGKFLVSSLRKKSFNEMDNGSISFSVGYHYQGFLEYPIGTSSVDAVEV